MTHAFSSYVRDSVPLGRTDIEVPCDVKSVCYVLCELQLARRRALGSPLR